MQQRYVKGNYEIGITQIQSPSLNPIWAYDLERTLCYILRGSEADISLVVDAYKRYAASKEKNVFKRMQYAKQLWALPKGMRHLEVLLSRKKKPV